MTATQRAMQAVYTGSSPFLKTNPWLLKSLWSASQHCQIEATEDILDSRGQKLWASSYPITADLLMRLSERELMKPIELCVRAKDPVSEAGIAACVRAACAQNPALTALVQPHETLLQGVLGAWRPNPQELLIISMMRHGGRDLLTHAAVVAALALIVAAALGVPPSRQKRLLQAGIFHDIGFLYLEPPEGGMAADPDEMDVRHTTIGALAAVELAHCDDAVGRLIAQSHERLNGTGFPQMLERTALTEDAQILLFAEAVAPHVGRSPHSLLGAALTTRLVPREFDERMVNWLTGAMNQFARSAAVGVHTTNTLADIGQRLHALHGVLARLMVMLSMPFGESKAVQHEIPHWKRVVDPLYLALRSTGIEEALSLGKGLDPESHQEALELDALRQDLSERLCRLRAAIAARAPTQKDFGNSLMVGEMLQLLGSLA